MPPFRNRLLALRDAELALRAEMAQAGEAGAGYDPRLRALHEANARELEFLIDDEGWPSPEVAGGDGAEVAWLIAMNAASRPTFMRRCLSLLKGCVNRGEAPARHVAMLEDRIRALEGRPQRYGTQMRWGQGGLAPLEIEEPEGVDLRRAAMGLPPLAETLAAARDAARHDGAPPPEEWEASSAVLDALAKEVGWR